MTEPKRSEAAPTRRDTTIYAKMKVGLSLYAPSSFYPVTVMLSWMRRLGGGGQPVPKVPSCTNLSVVHFCCSKESHFR